MEFWPEDHHSSKENTILKRARQRLGKRKCRQRTKCIHAKIRLQMHRTK